MSANCRPATIVRSAASHPTTSGAAGFDHYVQMVNTAMVVYDKSGNVLAGPVGTRRFWQDQPDCGRDQVWSDSVVRFDRYANRWIVARPGKLPSGQDLCVAISKTVGPDGAIRSVRVRGQQQHQSPG